MMQMKVQEEDDRAGARALGQCRASALVLELIIKRSVFC